MKAYHKLLWDKELPGGERFELTDQHPKAYLYHNSRLGEFILGSDAITHSYRNQKRKKWLTDQVPNDVKELFDAGSTIGAYILFPNNRIDNKLTINGARGCNVWIDDRFDLTLECIRLFYLGKKSPLYDTFLRFKHFFDLFENFPGYVNYFLLNDLVDENQNVKFYLPFDNFITRPAINSVEDYLTYKQKSVDFINARNKRIAEYAKLLVDK